MVDRLFHPREELEIFSYLIHPDSDLGLELRHWILSPVIGGGFINLLCRGRDVTDKVREYLYQMLDKIPIVHMYNAAAISEFSINTVLKDGAITIIDRFEESSSNDVDILINAKAKSAKEAGIICLTEVDELFSTDEIYEDIRFAELAVSGFFLFVIEDFMLSGLKEPDIKDKNKVLEHFLDRFALRD